MDIQCTSYVPNIDRMRSLNKFYSIISLKELATDSQKSLNIQVLKHEFSQDLRHRLLRMGKECEQMQKKENKKKKKNSCSLQYDCAIKW